MGDGEGEDAKEAHARLGAIGNPLELGQPAQHIGYATIRQGVLPAVEALFHKPDQARFVGAGRLPQLHIPALHQLQHRKD